MLTTLEITSAIIPFQWPGLDQQDPHPERYIFPEQCEGAIQKSYGKYDDGIFRYSSWMMMGYHFSIFHLSSWSRYLNKSLSPCFNDHGVQFFSVDHIHVNHIFAWLNSHKTVATHRKGTKHNPNFSIWQWQITCPPSNKHTWRWKIPHWIYIGNFPSKTSIYRGSPTATFDYRRVSFFGLPYLKSACVVVLSGNRSINTQKTNHAGKINHKHQ